jgi:hypothetical protein
MLGRLSLAFVVVSIAAFFCAQSVEAVKGPKVTHRVYFDIKHGDKDLGRSAFTPSYVLSIAYLGRRQSQWVSMGRRVAIVRSYALRASQHCADCS